MRAGSIRATGCIRADTVPNDYLKPHKTPRIFLGENGYSTALFSCSVLKFSLKLMLPFPFPKGIAMDCHDILVIVHRRRWMDAAGYCKLIPSIRQC